MKKYKLSSICKEIDISFNEKDIEIEGLHTLDEASSSQISFFNDKRYKNKLSNTKAGAVLIEEQYVSLLPNTTIALITDEPYLKLAL
ncbi:MAG TPA: UDP-3-O-(3-hydroxymyristoyl)glucosamine N-acyltransferase, partial [Campylobacterales bacterium]|nr:UDP-3-O-(3-hydroxymyristoyl)glucosamine N-acyltransferase [Campylobacterales bacterium]